MRSVLLFVGALACAQASLIDLNNITTPTDALAYVLNLKCIRERLLSSLTHYLTQLHAFAPQSWRHLHALLHGLHARPSRMHSNPRAPNFD